VAVEAVSAEAVITAAVALATNSVAGQSRRLFYSKASVGIRARRRFAQKVKEIPRACPVEFHVCCQPNQTQMPRACPGESHVYCYLALNVNLHGTSPWHPVFIAETIGVATNASLHGTRPWHLRLFVQSLSRPHSPCTANSLWSWTFE
jgi:hypothetical protein